MNKEHLQGNVMSLLLGREKSEGNDERAQEKDTPSPLGEGWNRANREAKEMLPLGRLREAQKSLQRFTLLIQFGRVTKADILTNFENS